MRDGYQRHPATHMGAQSNPYTPLHTDHKKHDYIHRYTGQERVCMQTQSHQAMITSAGTHPTSNKCMCIFVSVHIEHINLCLLLQFLFYLAVSSHCSLCAYIISLLPFLSNSRDLSNSIFPSQEAAPRPCSAPEVESSVQHPSLTPESCHVL